MLTFSFSLAHLFLTLLFLSSSFARKAEEVEPSAGCSKCKSSLTFKNPKAAEFAVGNNIPLLPFKTKNSWAGNIQVPDTPTLKNGSLFFWLWGQDSITPGDDLIIWLNGGPGCSSIGGMCTENGPFLIQSKFEGPTRVNPYSWTKAANILYVTHPSGVSFTTGERSFTGEEEISEQFVLWLNEFFKIFTELSNKKLWFIGESYAGVYWSYIHQYYTAKPPNGINKYEGGMLIDAIITFIDTQTELGAYYFALKNNDILKLTQDELAQIKNLSDTCGNNAFLEKNLQYPAKYRLPSFKDECDTKGLFFTIMTQKNPTFNYYNIRKPNPTVVDKNAKMSRDIFLSDINVQKYINVREPKPYIQCQDVFPNDDTDLSLPVDQNPSYENSILAQMIESSKRFYMLQGDLDAIVVANGTKIGLQNLTWNGGQGIKQIPTIPLKDLEGKQQALASDERGLRFIEVKNSGHKVPMDQPSFALAAVLALLGKRSW